jgi:hypothetical protein
VNRSIARSGTPEISDLEEAFRIGNEVHIGESYKFYALKHIPDPKIRQKV